jgi:hypothetical protein
VWVANARIDAAGQSHDAWTEPYLHYSLDDYVPVARIVLDRTTFALGETVRVAVPLETLGGAHGLDVQLALDLGGSVTPLGGASGVVLPQRGSVTAIVDVTIPTTLANVGIGALVVEVFEASTQDIVDIARASVTITP